MRTNIVWSEKFRDREGLEISVTDVAFHPDGSQLIVSAGSRLHVYSAHDGSLIQTLKGHKDTIMGVAYSRDGRRFASGSADKQVIIWTSKLEGMLRFTHNDCVRCMEFNPVTHQLASCCVTDFGLWSPEQKAVSKHKVPGQINACSWSSDGHHLALALAVGYVSVRNRSGEEKVKIERAGAAGAPVWGVSFSPVKDEDLDILAVIDWSQSGTLSFHDLSGKQVGKEKSLGYDPLSVQHFASGEYLLVSGSNRQAIMYTEEGIIISSLCELDSWIFRAKPNPSGTHVAVCGQDGTFSIFELVFSTVHSLYRERYAYRVNMTDVIIHHLMTDEKVRIKCRDLVKKLAVYKSRVAIQLSDKIVIYELYTDKESKGMHYRVKEKINQRLECTLLVVGEHSLVLCQDKRLQCLSFQGHLEREWTMEAYIRYIRATGGPPGKEGLLIGLKNGQIVQIFLNNPFPILIVQIATPVRCLDLSTNRKKLAVVDDKGTCSVYNVKTKELLYQESNANSVAWNSQFEEMLSFTGGGFLSIKPTSSQSDFATYHQQLQGFVVGFCGAKVFCLQFNVVTTIEISQSAAMHQFIDKKRFEEAYKTACLRVTDYDWNQLAQASLENLSLEVARKAFGRTRNWLHLELIESYLRDASTHNKSTELSFLGDVMAYKNHFNEAARLYKQAGHDDKAINMYTDLRMFDQAQELIRAGDAQFKKALAMKKADWVHNINEPRAAAEMYLSAGETTKAIEIIGQHGWVDMLMNVVRQLDKGDRAGLSLCAEYLVKHKQYFNAAEVFKKLGDVNNLAVIYVKSCQWEDAFKLVTQYPELREEVYVPYATWLAENERFVEAQQAFHKAGKINEALQVLQQLTNNAINEHRFSDAGYYCWILSLQCLELANEKSSSADRRERSLMKYEELQRQADIYYAYHNIHRYIEEPFTSFFPDALFNMARFLFHSVMSEAPQGVSKVAVLYALAKQGRNLGAFKLARLVYEKLHTLHIPTRYQNSIEMGDLTIRAKPFSDAEDLLPLCYRCSTTNPLYNSKGNQCINCQQPFMLSFATFDVLPVVEFELEDGLSDEEALQLIQEEESSQGTGGKSAPSAPQWEEEQAADFQTLKLYDTSDVFSNVESSEGGFAAGAVREDPFTLKMTTLDGGIDFSPVIVNRAILKQMNAADVLVLDWPPPLRRQFYKNLVPDMHITKCSTCNKFFHSDEFERHVLQKGCCPFCRNVQQVQPHLR